MGSYRKTFGIGLVVIGDMIWLPMLLPPLMGVG
jgi:hypothetical protein